MSRSDGMVDAYVTISTSCEACSKPFKNRTVETECNCLEETYINITDSIWHDTADEVESHLFYWLRNQLRHEARRALSNNLKALRAMDIPVGEKAWRLARAYKLSFWQACQDIKHSHDTTGSSAMGRYSEEWLTRDPKGLLHPTCKDYGDGFEDDVDLRLCSRGYSICVEDTEAAELRQKCLEFFQHRELAKNQKNKEAKESVAPPYVYAVGPPARFACYTGKSVSAYEAEWPSLK